jgi:hypothetical protein
VVAELDSVGSGHRNGRQADGQRDGQGMESIVRAEGGGMEKLET